MEALEEKYHAMPSGGPSRYWQEVRFHCVLALALSLALWLAGLLHRARSSEVSGCFLVGWTAVDWTEVSRKEGLEDEEFTHKHSQLIAQRQTSRNDLPAQPAGLHIGEAG